MNERETAQHVLDALRLAEDKQAQIAEVEGVAHTERVYGSKSLTGVSSSTISGSGPAS